jgi:hypothetical protein
MADAQGTLYYVGDIGYAMTRDEWNDAMMLHMDDFYALYHTFDDGRQFTLRDIGQGDVGNVGADGWHYCSDSGLIGIMKASDINNDCMSTIRTILEMEGARFVEIPAENVEGVLVKGLSPLGEKVNASDPGLVATTTDAIDVTNRKLYFVGDLRYVLDKEDWKVFLRRFERTVDPRTYSEPNGFASEIYLDDERAYDYDDEDETWEPWRPCYAFPTASGNGIYLDKEGRSYPVDSGSIGCIRVDHVDPERLHKSVQMGLGHIHEFDDAPLRGYDDDEIWFMNVAINTRRGSETTDT